MRQKLKTLYIHYYKAYDLKAYYGGDIPQGAPNRKYPRLLNKMVF